ncbi:MAG: adenylate/guanylate cyclase domain-containing protein [Candidatus Sericytochromatia bacterium]|nr:adenylate/guanylate cyclase domain-containing protein [Candidatus Tanganyikabacteria bacterium]
MHPVFARAHEAPVQERLVISVVDWERFAQFSRGRDTAMLFAALDGFYKLVEDQVSRAGGLVVKHLGDSSLVLFPADDADGAVACLLRLKAEVDGWFAAEGIDSRLQVSVHVGEAMVGVMGGPQAGRLDVVGEAVNLAFTLGSRGFVLSPQAFRALGADMRRYFHKFTPPIVYRAG